MDAQKNIDLTNQENSNQYRLSIDIVKDLWAKTYDTKGKPDWSHILPYYHKDIYFKDSIQEIRGIEDFKAMTERLTIRSKDLKMKIVNVFGLENNIFIGGAITGWTFEKPIPVIHKMQFSDRSTLTPIPSIYQAGQWAFSPAGVPMSILTGKLAADRILKKSKHS